MVTRLSEELDRMGSAAELQIAPRGRDGAYAPTPPIGEQVVHRWLSLQSRSKGRVQIGRTAATLPVVAPGLGLSTRCR